MGSDRRLVLVVVAAADAEVAADVLWRCGCSAVSEAPLEDGRVRLEADVSTMEPLAALPPGCILTEHDLPDDSYLDAWREFAEPVRVGCHLLVQPAWRSDVPAAPDDVVVRLDPGHAFGSGTHPTTRLVLSLLERFLEPGASVLDVGTGSGVLAVAAALLGASTVIATDLDPAAVRAARANAVANGVSERVVVTDLPLGSIDAVVDLVLANIGASVLRELAPDLLAHVRPGGKLILAGLLEDQATEVVGQFPRVVELERCSLDGWAAPVLRAPD